MKATPVSSIRSQLAACAAADLPALIDIYRDDPRPGVSASVALARRRFAHYESERTRLAALSAAEWRLADAGVAFVAGVDEVGRGALAGPVCAGACVLPREVILDGLDDSKRLSARVRSRLCAEISAVATSVAVGHAEPAEIDALGIAKATTLAMGRALAGLGVDVGHVLVDGRAVDLGIPSTAVVRGDSSVRAIAAAAIVAKVTRDALMAELDAVYPGYGLAENKGYGSPGHLSAIAELGPSPIHRRSFAPCSQITLF